MRALVIDLLRKLNLLACLDSKGEYRSEGSWFARSITHEKVNLNNGLHLKGGWIGVVEQFKKFSQQRLPNLRLSQCQKTSLPTTFQQSITSTSKNVCTNTLPTIYKCNTHANASIILKNKSKEQLSPQIISIYSTIPLTKMSRKIIKDIPWIITLISPHISSIQHVCPSNQWYQKQK